MVIFITSRSAYSEMKSLIASGMYPIWLTCDVLSEKEVEVLLKSGVNASVLDYAVDTENADNMSCAMSTIKEHHVGQNIWVQVLNEN